MLRSFMAASLAVLLLLLAAAPASGQSRPRRVTEGDAEPLALDAAFVHVPVVVADRGGRYVANLSRDDFALSEDGVPQEIALFEPNRVPIHIAILMDASSSTRGSLDEIREAAAQFTDLLLPGDQVTIVVFNDKVRVEQKFTSDRGRLRKAIRRAETRRGTKLYDAVYETVDGAMRRVDGRKAVILLSDGDDSRSDRAFEEAVAACVESDVTVYGLRYPKSLPNFLRIPRIPKIPGVGWPLAGAPWAPAPSPDDFMETITAQTGGTLHNARSISDLPRHLEEIADELRHVYLLGYAPSNPLSNGGYRRISVRVPSDPDLAVKHRLGYRAAASP